MEHKAVVCTRRMYHNHLENMLSHGGWAFTPRDSNSEGLGWSLGVCISNSLDMLLLPSGDPTLRTTGIKLRNMGVGLK